MTNRYHTLTVVLTKDMRYDDAAALMNAIRQMRGVCSVSGVVSDLSDNMAQSRVRRELADKLWAILYPKDVA